MEFVLWTLVEKRRVWFWWTGGQLYTTDQQAMRSVKRIARTLDADLHYGSDTFQLLCVTFDCVVTLMPTDDFMGPLVLAQHSG